MCEPTESPDLDGFALKSTRFVEWFKNANGTRLSNKIQLADLRDGGAGRGVVAIQDLAEDEEVFALPLQLVLMPATSSLPDEVQVAVSEYGPWPALIVTLIFEMAHSQTSKFSEYLDLLPESFDTLMFWNDAELAQLQASAVLNKVGKSSAEESWRHTIIPLMQKYREHFAFVSEDEAEEASLLNQRAHEAGSLIMAYAFDIDRDGTKPERAAADSDGSDFEEDDEDEPLKGMVPFADMLNADADRNNARLFQEDDYLIMRATKSIGAGEEIFNDYGPLPRSDLLRMYGYITKNYEKYDVVELEHDLFVEVAGKSDRTKHPAWQKREDQMIELGIADDGYAIQRPAAKQKLEDVIPGDIHMILRGLCLDETTTKMPKINTNESISVEEAALLSAACTKRLSEYATSLDEDHNLLKALAKDDPVDNPADVDLKRSTMAVEVRAGEKEILQDLIHLCQDHITTKTYELTNTAKKRGPGTGGDTQLPGNAKKTKLKR